MSRYCFFGGKGGTGKTSLSSAWALSLARRGRHVLAVSTDPAHSLADAMGKPIGSTIVPLEENLWAIEVDAGKEAAAYVARIEGSMKGLISPAIVADVSAQLRLSASSPGAEESALFDAFIDLMESADDEGTEPRFDTVVFDTAPTGHTLRLLALPELLGFWMDHLIAKRAKAMDLMKLAAAYEQDLAERMKKDPIYDILCRRRKRFEWAKQRLTDGALTVFHPILNAEKLSFLETRRAVIQLSKFGIRVGKLCVNRLIPPEAGEFFARHRERQAQCMAEIRSAFGDFGVLEVPWLDGDVQGESDLEQLVPHLEGLED